MQSVVQGKTESSLYVTTLMIVAVKRWIVLKYVFFFNIELGVSSASGPAAATYRLLDSALGSSVFLSFSVPLFSASGLCYHPAALYVLSGSNTNVFLDVLQITSQEARND